MKLDRSTFTRPWRAALAPLMAALVLAGCATATPEAPSFQAPAQFKEQAAAPAEGQWTRATPAEAQPRGEWWRAFNDPVLDALVARADAANNSIQVAAARLAEARALARSTDADRSPQIGLGAGASRQRGLDRNQSTTPSTLINAGLDFSYELDLFGRLSKASDAARLDAESRAGLLQSTRLLVQAETAQTYLALRALDDERQLVRETVEAYRDTLRLTQQRHRAGDIAELDVARVETEMASTESEALTLDRRRAELEHALAVLTGEPASSFEMKPDNWATALPAIPAGVPATVLTRRPDVSAAQKGVLAAQARVGVAQTAWFPNIALTGGGGYASSEIGDLFKWSARSWGSVRCCRCRCSTAAGARPACRAPAPSWTARSRATANRCSRPSGTWKTSSPRCASSGRSRRCRPRRSPRRAGPRSCPTRAIATATSASSTCSTRAAASCATGARRCRCGPHNTSPQSA